MGKLKSVIILFLLISLLTVYFPEAQAQTENIDINIACANHYYLKGETATIYVTGNASLTYNLTVLNPSEQPVYQKGRQLNASGQDTVNLPIPQAFDSGTYTIKASSGSFTATTWVTIVHTEDYSATSFPFNRNHKNVNYTIKAKGFTAVSSSANITVTYPSLPVSFQVNAYTNNMTLVVRLKNTGLGIHIDLTYLFIYVGMKIKINGTIPEPTTYSFKMESPGTLITKTLSLRDGLLVFDWSDLKKARKSFSYNATTKSVTVNIPASFDIDPYVFEDSFETNDYSAWTGTTTGGNGALATASDQKHCGTYSSKATWDSSGDTAYSYKTISASNLVYTRLAFRLDNLPGTNTNIMVLNFYDGANFRDLLRIYADMSSGDVSRWYIAYRNAGTQVITDTDSPPSADTWIYVEGKADLSTADGTTDGSYEIWVNGVSIWSIDTCDTDSITLNTVRAGLGGTTHASANTLWVDCVVVDSSHIGVESSNTAPSVGSITSSDSNPVADVNFNVSCAVNDADGVAEFDNCTLSFDDDWGHTFSLKWVNSTNTFSENSDPSNYVTLQGGSRTTVNSTAYTLTWTFLIRETFPEEPVDVEALVFDSTDNGTATSNDLFTFDKNQPDQSGTYTPPEDSTPESNEATPGTLPSEFTPSPGQGNLNISPVMVVGLIAVGIVIVSAYTGTATLKKSRTQWKKKKKAKTPEWKTPKPWE